MGLWYGEDNVVVICLDVDGVDVILCAGDGVMFWLLLCEFRKGLLEFKLRCFNADVGVFLDAGGSGVFGVIAVTFLPVEKNGLLATDKGIGPFGVENLLRLGVLGVDTFSIVRRGVVFSFPLVFATIGVVGVSSIFLVESVTLPRRRDVVTKGDVSMGKYFGVRRLIMSSESSESRIIGPSRRLPLE